MEYHHMIEEGDHIITGVSGGADSVCLLLILNQIMEQMKLKVTVVHVEHGIRGAASREDASFVEQLCQELAVPFRIFSCQVPQYAKEHGLSVEEGARKLRYFYFEQVQQEMKAQKIAVAHNQDDCAETLLFHLARGTGIKGMGAIAPVRGTVIRPLLGVARTAIEEYLKTIKQTYRMDATNHETIYTRNKIRHHVIPQLTNINDKAVLHLSEAAEAAREAGALIEQLCRKAQEKHVQQWLLLDSIKQEPPLIQKSVIHQLLSAAALGEQDITKVHVKKIKQLLVQPTGKQLSMPRGLIVKRTYEGILFLPQQNKEPILSKPHWKLPQPSEKLELTAYDWCLTTKIIEKIEEIDKIPKKRYTKWIDYDKIKSNVQIRTRQTGDFFILDQTGQRKKLKDFFINEKIPAQQREQMLLVADGFHVIWIIGYRISAEYKITKHTKRILELQISGGETYE
jgi:tRNA(Ile)-lysidine synthase